MLKTMIDLIIVHRIIFCILLYATMGGIAWGLEPREVSIQVESVPSGADICEKQRGRLICFAKTPSAINSVFYGSNSSKVYYIKKIGYEISPVLFHPGSQVEVLQLTKKNIFYDKKKHQSSDLERLQGRVNEILGNRIYGNEKKPLLENFQFVDKIKVIKLDGTNQLNINLMVGDQLNKEKLGRIIRIRNKNERVNNFLNVVLNNGAGSFLVQIKNVMDNISEISGIMLTVNYHKKTSELAEDDATFVKRYEYQPGDGWVYYSWAEHNTGYSKFEIHKDIYTTMIGIQLNQIPKNIDEISGLEKMKSLVTIKSNDNRRKIFREYQYE